MVILFIHFEPRVRVPTRVIRPRQCSNPNRPPNPRHQVTLGYNMARVKEAAGELKAATAEYEKLLEK